MLAAIVSCAVLATMSGQAGAAPPPAAPGCVSEGRTFDGTSGSIQPSATSSFVVNVGGLGASLYHVALATRIDSAHTGDLSIALVAPGGKSIAVRADDINEEENVFDPTVWEDSAPEPGAKTVFANDLPAGPLEPDQAFAGLDGIDPDGTWQLAITSSSAAVGELIGWSLEVSTCQSAPSGSAFSPASDATVAVPAVGTAVSTISTSGLPCFLESASVQTDLSDSLAAAITMSLSSPEGQTVVLTSGNGGSAAEVFSGTLWQDAAPTRVTSAPLTSGKVSTPLEPQQGLSRLIGENPNGTWTLNVANDAANGGSLRGWTLNLLAAGNCPASTTQPPTGPTAKPILTPIAATTTITGIAFRPERFAVRSRHGAHHRLSGGSHVTFSLSAASAVHLSFQMLITGVRSGARCLPKGAHRHGRPCTLTRGLAGGLTVAGRAGANSLAFAGRLAGRALARGHYRLLATSSGPSKPAQATFTII